MDEEESCAKKIKLNEESDRDDIGVGAAAGANAVVPAPNEEQPPDIFKLNIDCFEDVFDYSPIKDLICVGKTCKRLQKVAGHCFRQTYPNVTPMMYADGIRNNSFDLTHFAEFLHEIRLRGCRRSEIEAFSKIQSKLRRLTKLEICCLKCKDDRFDRMKETFGKLEVLTITEGTVAENFEQIIDQCAKLKCLQINAIVAESSWYTKKYPSLEYLDLKSAEVVEPMAMVSFLELNPNIRRFGVLQEFLMENCGSFTNANNIKFDELEISCEYKTLKPFFRLLKELHEHGLYQRLELELLSSDETDTYEHETYVQMATLRGLVKLVLMGCDNVSLSAFESLEEISIYWESSVKDIECAANKLVNLKRIHLDSTRFDDIMPFIRRSTSLQRIRIFELKGGLYFNEDTKIVDLMALNRERQQLADAEKIILYVDEPIYLATKWALKETNFDLIRLRRLDSLERHGRF